MSDQYITAEVDKVVNESGFEFPKSIAMASAWILGNLKGVNLKVLDVRNTSSLADYFVLGSASNPTQARAMADLILVHLKRHGAPAISKEGMEDADWILLDLGDILVHIFLETSRDIYNLDSLWTEAKSEEIPHSYYFSSDAAGAASNDDEKGYF